MRIRRRWRADRELDRDIEDELQFHIEQQTAAGVDAGLDPAEARRQAQAMLGGCEAIMEECRAQRPGAWAGDFMRDLRLGWRLLRRQPGFAAVAVITLALAIGANTAVFSCLDAVLRLAPPFPQADRIVALVSLDAHGALQLGNPFRSGDFADFRAHAAAFEVMAGWDYKDANLAADGHAEHVQVMRITQGFFKIWGVAAAAGRTFLPGEITADRRQELVLSDNFWRGPLGGAAVVGHPISVDGVDYTVIGIMPRGFATGVFDPDVWMALPLTPAQLAAHQRSTAATLQVAGRLRPGATLAQAQAEIRALSMAAAQRYPEERGGGGATAITEQEAMHLRLGASSALSMLLGVSGLVLLIGCISVAALSLERGSARRAEMATRYALGAPRGRLLRQLLTESLLIAAMAGVVGLGLGWLVMRWLNATLLASASLTAHLDARILVFTAGVALLTVLLSGLAPAWHNSRIEQLAQRSAASRTGGSNERLRSALIVGEVALALVCLVASATLIQAIWQQLHAPMGYEPAGVLAAELSLSGSAYADAQQRAEFESSLASAVTTLPGAQAAALVSPPAMSWDQPTVQARGHHLHASDGVPLFKVLAVTSGYFRTLRIRRLAGRDFLPSDVPGAASVAIVSRTAARRLFPGVATPIGQYLRIVRAGEPAWRVVVGEVDDTSFYAGEAANERVNVYEPLVQASPPSDLGILMRAASGPPGSLAPGLRQTIQRLDAAQPIFGVQPLSAISTENIDGDRYLGDVLSALAALVLLSAAVGLYGIVAYAATRRRRESAIRLAFGAPPVSLTWLLSVRGLRLAGMGVSLGLILAWLDSFLLASVFSGIATRNVGLFAVPTSVLLAVVVAASYLPAHRAARVAPMAVLKEQ